MKGRTMSGKTLEVERILNQEKWHKERKTLRSLLLDFGLEEEVKWGKLCYTFQGSNVAIIYGLRNYCAVGFFKGSLLSGDEDVLIKPGKHSRAMRQIRFSGLKDITAREKTLVGYIEQAIQIEKDGLEVDFDENDELSCPDELKDAFDDDPDFAAAFENLTPGRQRGYVIHFSGAKQSKTRASRIRKCKPDILDGKGLNGR